MPDSTCRQAATWANRRTTAHSGLEKGQGQASTRQYSKNSQAKTLGLTLPLPSVLISASHSTCPTALGSHLRASWGLTLTLDRPQRGLSQGAWLRNAGDWGLPSPSARLTLSTSHHTGESGPRRSFRTGEMADTPSPRRPLKALHTKCLGPMPPLPSALNLARHSSHHTAFCWVMRPPWG